MIIFINLEDSINIILKYGIYLINIININIL